jgi:hypothetical protein
VPERRSSSKARAQKSSDAPTLRDDDDGEHPAESGNDATQILRPVRPER